LKLPSKKTLFNNAIVSRLKVIWSARDINTDIDLDPSDTKDVQSIPLSWAPTKIIHAPLEEDPFEMAILVGGSDSCVHFFVQDSINGAYEEQPIETHFSVLASFSYCEYWLVSIPRTSFFVFAFNTCTTC
jgi:hypothetical protein